MKFNHKRISRSTLSVILAFCMLLSCFSVGLISTEAAYVDDEPVSYTEYNLASGQVFYFDNSSTGWTSVKLMVMKKNGGDWSGGPWDLTQVSGSNYWKFTAPEAWNGYTHYLFYSGTWSNATQTNDIEGELASSSWYTNCFTPTANTNAKWGGSFSKCVGVKNFSVTPSPVISGSGTSSSPYIVARNTSITLTASSTKIDSNYTTNYSFDGTNYGTGTTSSFTSSSTGDYSFNKTVYVKTTRGSYESTPVSKKIYFKTAPAETTYSVSVVSEDTSKGTVAGSTVSAGATTAVTIPTATPKYGYKFKQWVATSPASIASGATSATAGKVTATGTGGKVTAQFEPDTSMNLYIAGRFHVRTASGSSDWTNSFDSGDWSTTDDDNIKFTHESGTIYKVETYASVAELSTQISGIDPYFFVYDTDAKKAWHPTASVSFNGSTMSASLTTNTDTYNVRFDDTSNNDSPVTLYFNTATKELSYDVPNYYTVTCNTATGGTVSSDVSRQREDQTVTLTLSPSSGYNIGTVTVKDASNNTVTVSGTGNTRTFTMPASNVTVSATFTEITHTVYVRKRYFQSNGTTVISTESTNTQKLTGVGIATAKQVNAAPTVTDYTFYKFTLPTGVTLKSGSLTTEAAITVNATVDNAVIYIDYKETMHTLTLVNSPTAGGSIKKSGSSDAITTIQVGNVTGVTLVATPTNGYQFSGWTKSANTVTIGNTANASTTFKTSADATVTANYTAVNYTITAAANPAAGAAVEIWNTTKTQQVSGGHIGDKFRIYVTFVPGYAFDSISGVPSGGTVITNDATSYVAEYTLSNSNVNATIQLKAAKPTFASVKIRDRNSLNTAIDSCTAYASGSTVNTYYLQPVYAKATMADAFTSTITYATQTKDGASIGSDTNTPCNIDADPTIIPTKEGGSVTYNFTVTATNSPAGVTAATATRNYTIRVYFNDAQKAYFRLNHLLSHCVSIGDGDRSYFKDDAGATITNYNSAFSTATTYISGGYPVYNASSADVTTAENNYNSFNTAFTNLMDKAKTTTVYVLTNYANSAANPINVTFYKNNNYASGYDILCMYNYGKTINTNAESRHTTYEGYVTKSTNRYFYSITYAGRGNIRFWRGSSATDAAVATTEYLTGSITGATPFVENYVNVYNTTVGQSSTSTAISVYADFDHSFDSGKKYLEIGDVKTKQQIIDLFNINPIGSMVTAPGITVTNTAFTIKGPIDKGDNTTVDLYPNDSTFTATKQGRYTVSYTSHFGYDASGKDITRTKEMTLYVAYDDITVYVDMNDNIGNPILNFKYFTNNAGAPVKYTSISNNTPVQPSGSSVAYLPYEMELVTGSESVYKYTIKLSKLRNEYYIARHEVGGNVQYDQLVISYITVERTKIGEGTGFAIPDEARITGEMWLKADSSHMSTFQTISCGSVSKSFIAVTESGTHTLLGEAFDALHGTGIITDTDEIYNAQYAGLYKLDGATAPMNKFHYVVNASAKREVKSGNNTYYFDKWIVCPTSSVSYNDAKTIATYSNSSDIGDEDTTALNFTAAPDYADGNGDKTYIALYKPVQSGDTNVRVEITYKFKDYDTSDGNFVFDKTINDYENENKNKTEKTVDTSYTKTVNVTGAFNTVKSQVAALAQSKAPYIKSNYFDYSFKADSTEIVSELPNESKIKITAELEETPHKYTIILKNGNNVISTNYGYYQQTVQLASGGFTNPVWKIASGSTDTNVVLGSGATGSTFTARYVAVNSGDTQVIKVASGTSTAANNKSVVSDAYTEVYYADNGTEMLRHNFYIIDYCAEGKLTGGGVLFATTDGTNYRQSNAATVLASTTTRKNFISGILNNDFETEYKAQTINNVGFRYKPFKSTEDVYRYSDDLKAYITIYDGTNVNSTNYDGQKLRLFSFMVYDNNGTKVIVPSDGYAEVDRYQPQS